MRPEKIRQPELSDFPAPEKTAQFRLSDFSLLVASEAREFAGILRHCRAVRRLRLPVQYARQADLNGRRLVLVADGPGPLAAAATERAISDIRPAAVVSVGVCGALDPALATGDIFVPLDCPAPSSARQYRSGTLLSADHVVVSVEEKQKLWRAGAAAVEMEAELVAAVARRHGLPFYCIRAVMDRADQEFALDFNRLRDRRGRFSRLRILRAALARPAQLLPELIRLGRQGRQAALALGDFVADCGF